MTAGGGGGGFTAGGESVDSRLHLQAKQTLKDCDRRKKEGDPEHQSLSEALPKRMRETVWDVHWAKVLSIHRQYLKQKQMRVQMQSRLPLTLITQ